MATVFEAHHAVDSHPVALKVLKPDIVTDPSFIAAFGDEVRAAAKLDHARGTTVNDHGIISAEEAGSATGFAGAPWLAMELVDGGTISSLAGKLKWAQLRFILIDVLDALGRSFQGSTIQLDFQLPRRFELTYVGADNSEHVPVVIHRAVFGSFERFIGILIEHYAGDFPLWLAPVQARVLPITERHADYGQKVRERLHSAGIRAEIDDRNEKLNFKIREAELQKVPIMLVVGDQEEANGTVTPRRRKGPRGATEAISVDAWIAQTTEEIRQRR